MMPENLKISLSIDPNIGTLIVDLHREGYLNLDPRFEPGPLEGFLDHVRETMATTDVTDADRCKVWVAEIAGKPVGCAALILHPEARGQIRWVIVTPQARGLGAGKRLIHAAVDYARNLSLTHLHLETIDHLPAAMGIYEALGFEITERIPTEFWYGKDDMVLMEMKLSNLT